MQRQSPRQRGEAGACSLRPAPRQGATGLRAHTSKHLQESTKPGRGSPALRLIRPVVKLPQMNSPLLHFFRPVVVLTLLTSPPCFPALRFFRPVVELPPLSSLALCIFG